MSSVDWRKLEDVPSVAPWLTVASSVRGEDDNKPRVSHSISDNEDVTEREKVSAVLYCVSELPLPATEISNSCLGENEGSDKDKENMNML